MMKVFFSCACLWLSLSLSAQICSGNLGENIFTAGDFGSGFPNVITSNPGIAPGYSYTTIVPPFDGFYTLTNNSSVWPNGFDTWLDIPDNSSDPNGYFMIVNASFAPGLFYQQEVDDLCENTLYTFSADIINMIRTGVNDHIAPNISFLINGVEQFSTGNVPQNATWINYGFNFTTAPGQTTVTLSLRNNAPGGIGNDVGLDNITFRACGPMAQILPLDVELICGDGVSTTLTATIDGDQYPTPVVQWQQSLDEGVTWSDLSGATNLDYTPPALAGGLYYYRYLLANGPQNITSTKCRVVSNVKIIEVVPRLWAATDTICEGLTYFTSNSSYTVSGIYTDTLLSSLGCDSIVLLALTFIPDPGLQLEITTDSPACEDQLGSLTIANVTNGTPPYTYFINDSMGGPVFNGLPLTTYQLAAEDRFGCRTEDSVALQIPQPFNVDLGPDQRILLGESVRFSSVANEEVVDFAWTPALPNCPPDCSSLEITPAESQQYRLVATSALGCLATDSVFIEVRKVRQVYIPNAFSPNFDGVNDVFRPFANVPNVQEILSLKIFNRWGALVHNASNAEPNSTAGGWTGTFRGRTVDPGTYVYVAEVIFLDGFIGTYDGTVVVLP